MTDTEKVKEWAEEAVGGKRQRKLPPHLNLHLAGLFACHCACLAYGSYLRGLIATGLYDSSGEHGHYINVRGKLAEAITIWSRMRGNK